MVKQMMDKKQAKKAYTRTQQKREAAGNLLDLIQLREIRDGVICFHPGNARTKKHKQQQASYKAVIAVAPVNFALMSEQEQDAVLVGFRVFLLRLAEQEHLSIHIRTLPYDLTPYLHKLEEAK